MNLEFHDRFQQYLAAQKLPYSPLRKRVVEAVCQMEHKFTANAVLTRIRKTAGPNVSRATLYRTLHLLVLASMMTVTPAREDEEQIFLKDGI